MKSYDLIGTFLYDLLMPHWRLDLGVERHAYDTSRKFMWNCYFKWKIHFFTRLSCTRIIPGCSTDPGLYPYYFHDLWLLSLSSIFTLPLLPLNPPPKPPESDSLVGGKCNVWEQWDVPFLPKSAPSLAHSTGDHQDLLTGTLEPGAATKTQPEDLQQRIDWPLNESGGSFDWQKKGGSERQLNMLLRGAATVFERVRVTR